MPGAAGVAIVRISRISGRSAMRPQPSADMGILRAGRNKAVPNAVAPEQEDDDDAVFDSVGIRARYRRRRCRAAAHVATPEVVSGMSTQAADAMEADGGIPGVSPYVVALREMLRTGAGRSLKRLELGGLGIELVAGPDSIWALIRRPGRGGFALRAVFVPAGYECRIERPRDGELARLVATSAHGEHIVVLSGASAALERLRMTVRFTPRVATLEPFLPRDFYPLGEGDDPLAARGTVEAAQRGLNSGLLYLRMEEPNFGNILYFQNLTAMNDYYRATKTKPDGAVGGEWPELGYLPPTPPQSGTPPTDALAADEEITLSDAIIVIRDHPGSGERESAREFLQMLGIAYKELDRPPTEYHDWIKRSEQTLKDLETAPEARVHHYGNLYIRPYTAAEYPDSMVQMSLIAAVHEWGKWRNEPHPLEAELMKGMRRFYDPKLKTIRRYLPNVGDDKNADAVDSWYLYHPLLNLGRLALDGVDEAERLLMDSVDYAIGAARHFDYRWPVQYDITNFSVITPTAYDGLGQTDVGGLYAQVMLQLYDLTHDDRFLVEARTAIDVAKGMKFNLNYQANLTAWGAAACMRLWRITDEAIHRDQSYVYLASFFHNCEIWQSRIERAAHYDNFLGVTCLQDAPYMAIYECFDSFAAFESYLANAGPDLDPAVRLLVSEYCKYALDRAWYYYPDALPPDILATDIRNGHIDRNLSFPLEDLYPDGQPAGQVGQEIYGAGAAFTFATRSFHDLDAPFRLFCNQFVRSTERTSDTALALHIDGGETCTADLCVLRLGRRKLPKITLQTDSGDALRPRERTAGHLGYTVPANGRLILRWE